MRVAIVSFVVVLVACSSRAAGPTQPPAHDPAQLPPGITRDCFIAGRCQVSADLDGDGTLDRVVLVAREARRGFAVLWGDRSRSPTVVGAGMALAVRELGDEDTPESSLGSARDGELGDDLGYLEAWDVLEASDGGGRRVLRGAAGRARPPVELGFLPDVHGDGLRISGGDAAYALYLSAHGTWYLAPLGY